MIPISLSYETSGTFVNVSGLWQTFESCCNKFGDILNGYEAIILLSKKFNLSGFEYKDTTSVLDEIKYILNNNSSILDLNKKLGVWDINSLNENFKLDYEYNNVSLYKEDSLLRRSVSLHRRSNI